MDLIAHKGRGRIEVGNDEQEKITVEKSILKL